MKNEDTNPTHYVANKTMSSQFMFIFTELVIII